MKLWNWLTCSVGHAVKVDDPTICCFGSVSKTKLTYSYLWMCLWPHRDIFMSIVFSWPVSYFLLHPSAGRWLHPKHQGCLQRKNQRIRNRRELETLPDKVRDAGQDVGMDWVGFVRVIFCDNFPLDFRDGFTPRNSTPHSTPGQGVDWIWYIPGLDLR